MNQLYFYDPNKDLWQSPLNYFMGYDKWNELMLQCRISSRSMNTENFINEDLKT